MMIQKNIFGSYLITLLTLSTILFTSPSTIFGIDTTIYEKGQWVFIGRQCPQGAAGPATEPVNQQNKLNVSRIYMQYKIIQTYDNCYTLSGGYYQTSAGCKDGSIVPASYFSSPPCLAGYITTQCVDFPDYPGYGPQWEGDFPIIWICSDFTDKNGIHRGWAFTVRAFCTKDLYAYEWRLNEDPDSASNFGSGGPGCNQE